MYHNFPVIYKIESKLDGNLYIGSAEIFSRRKTRHLHDLRKGKHHSPYLQRAWNKYGEGNFEIVPVIYCDKSNLILYEQMFLDKLRPAFNVNKVANSMLGFKHKQESKDKMRVAKTGRKRWWKIDTTNGIQASIGNEFSAKTYTDGLVSPDGKIFAEIHNLHKFCRERDLDSGHMLMVLQGKRLSHLGWKRLGEFQLL